MVDYTLPLDQLPDPLPIEPLRKPFDVTITPPGSKSITCRAYVLAALAQGESKIIRPLRADDTDCLLNALCILGSEARWEGEDVYIKGVNGRFPRGGSLYMGEGGTPTRFMIACACLAAEPVVIDASPRMRERPIAEGVDMLRQLGAKIEYVEAEGRLPVRVVPSEEFLGEKLTIGKTASSQFISAIVLIAPALQRGIELCFSAGITSWPYLELTRVTMMGWELEDDNRMDFQERSAGDPTWGVLVGSLQIDHQTIHAREYRIEPDASSAVYWLFAAATNQSARINIPDFNLESAQPDVGLLPIFYHNGPKNVSSEIGGVQLVGGDRFAAYSFPGDGMPDGVLAYAGVAAIADGVSKITRLGTLRVKETDRIAALANELRRVGCVVESGEDRIEITPPVIRPPAEPGAKGVDHTSPVVIETYNDHRMAMAFAVLGLNPPNGVPLAIRNPKCVAKSYPGFWKDFAKLYQ